ncbi:M20 aminoacylase family protein [Caballeronia sp. BR00000012568055]|uniref:M20 aminoacylase family protein n=1 Tax=Caballeronia sp. BR00000012568055 TaxID=2918761 RepID=UPI0023FA44CF|nr:M20 aminoacylase family protein [Caballeronia sp. BR00000012568055]
MLSVEPVIPGIAAIAPELVAVRQRIHAHPELAFEEKATSDLVAGLLAQWGYEVHRGLGKTGVVGVLKQGDGGKRIGLRADMDALPIEEATGLPYASKTPRTMHACGHDGHTAMLLCAARYLSESRQISGTLTVIFQPAEEGEAGARAMIEDGLFDKFPCDAIFGLHNMPGLPAGDMFFCPGPGMASSDRVNIVVRGVGGHGAMPHRARDPMPAVASIMLGLNSIVAREVDAQKPAVVSVGSVQAGEANNVIPETALLKLSVRALDPTVRMLLKERITALVHAQALAYGCTAEIDYELGYPVLVNHAEPTAFATDVATKMLGAQRVDPAAAPLMGSEDFAFMLEARPGTYAWIGNGTGSKGGCMVHNPGYDFNDDILAIGASYWVRLAEAYLAD